MRFNETLYLAQNPDVKHAVECGDIRSGSEHWQRYGRNEWQEGKRRAPVDFTRDFSCNALGDGVYLLLYSEILAILGVPLLKYICDDKINNIQLPYLENYFLDPQGSRCFFFFLCESQDAPAINSIRLWFAGTQHTEGQLIDAGGCTDNKMSIDSESLLRIHERLKEATTTAGRKWKAEAVGQQLMRIFDLREGSSADHLEGLVEHCHLFKGLGVLLQGWIIDLQSTSSPHALELIDTRDLRRRKITTVFTRIPRQDVIDHLSERIDSSMISNKVGWAALITGIPSEIDSEEHYALLFRLESGNNFSLRIPPHTTVVTEENAGLSLIRNALRYLDTPSPSFRADVENIVHPIAQWASEMSKKSEKAVGLPQERLTTPSTRSTLIQTKLQSKDLNSFPETDAKESNPYPSKATGNLLGNFEFLSSNLIKGWAWDSNEPDERVELELWVDGEKHIGFTADIFRSDLKREGIGNGQHAFILNIPTVFMDNAWHTFDIRFAATGNRIENSPRSIATQLREDSLMNCSIFYDHVLLKEAFSTKRFENALINNNKVAILCSYTPEGMRYGYHEYLKQAIETAGYVPLLVHSSPDEVTSDEVCFKSTDFYLIKRNEGYDFGSWMAGLYRIRHYFDRLEEVILINDSVFGPLFDINPLLEKMRSSACDFWGIVDSFENSYHLQSFFLCFKRRILQEHALKDFLSQYQFSNNKSDIIEQGEIGMSRFLISRGFTPAAVYSYRDLANKWLGRIGEYRDKLSSFEENGLLTLGLGHAESGLKTEAIEAAQFISSVSRSIRLGLPVNPMHFFWDILIEERCPYIKRELLFKNIINHPFHFEIINTLKSRSDYPVEYIYECAVRYGTNRVI